MSNINLTFGDTLWQTDELLHSAICRIRQCLKHDPENVENLRKFADLLRQQGDLSGARKQYLNLLELLPSDPAAKYLKYALNSGGLCIAPERLEQSCRFYFRHNFLDRSELLAIWDLLNDSFDKRVSSQIGDWEIDTDIRRSHVIYENNLKPIRQWFLGKVSSEFSRCWPNLYSSVPEIGKAELQLTHHGDEGHYRLHRDDTQEGEARNREVTFAFYFFGEPKRFSGGDLALLDQPTIGSETTTYTRFKPDNNTIIFFPSCLYHQVNPVKSQTAGLAGGRFTLNGWLYSRQTGTL